jgi:acetone carboxylase alpha subunit
MTEAAASEIYGYGRSAQETERRRAEIRKRRLAESMPAEEWWAKEQSRARTGDVSPLVAQMYARSAQISDSLKKAYLQFWKLENFPYTETGMPEFQTPPPTGFYFPKSGSRGQTNGTKVQEGGAR